MSCYLLNQRSINYLVDAAQALGSAHQGRVLQAPANEIGQSLTDENVRSVNSRYATPRHRNEAEHFACLRGLRFYGDVGIDANCADALAEIFGLDDAEAASAVKLFDVNKEAPEVFTWNPLGEGVSLSTMQGVPAHYGSGDVGQIFKLLDCYEYQACEADTWEDSTAKKICEALRDAYCGRVAGYEDAKWGLDDYTHEVETIVR